MSEKKDIQLWNMEQDLLIPKPNLSRLQYYEDEIERLTSESQAMHKKLTEAYNQLDTYRVKRLETFRKVFLLDCLILRRELDLLQCRDTIAEGRCTFHKRCKERNDLLEKLHLESGDLSGYSNPRRESPLT